MGSLQKIVLMIGREIPDETHSKEPFRNPYVFTNSINWREAALADTKALLEERREERSKPVHLQNTYVSRAHGGNIPRIRKEIAALNSSEMPNIIEKESVIPKSYRDKYEKLKDEKKRRQTNRELIESKRDIFQLEFAIKTKRDVIARLKFKSLLAEHKMTEAEKRLIHDTQLFDEFLQVTNDVATEAMRQADMEERRQKAKMAQIKQLNAQLSESRSEICRLENVFALKDEIKQFVFLVHQNHEKFEFPLVQSSKKWTDHWEKTKMESKEIPFSSPSALLERIFELEDRNLSLIGHFQQSEEEFEEIKDLFHTTAVKLDSQIEQLKSHMDLVESTVSRNNARAEELKFYCSMFSCSEFDDQDAELAHFEKEIERVYNATNGASVDMNIDSLTMLTFIETRMEDLIEMEDAMNPERVKEEYKEREKQRRIAQREQKHRDQDQAQKERLLRAQMRNTVGRTKRVGRRLVTRSRPSEQLQPKPLELLENNVDHEADFLAYQA